MASDTLKGSTDAAGLAALVARAAEQTAAKPGREPRGPAPVDRWDPPFCGDIDMEIRSDGSWYYLGTPIGRAPLVRLFSTVLRKDADGKTYLVTPVEKVGIRVEDAAFAAVEMSVAMKDGHEVLVFRTNVGDIVEAGGDHALRFSFVGPEKALKPYLHVRGRLEALVTRALTYDLIARGQVVELDGRDMFCITSGGVHFPLMPADELDLLSQ